jgi:hypothetical protein
MQPLSTARSTRASSADSEATNRTRRGRQNSWHLRTARDLSPTHKMKPNAGISASLSAIRNLFVI